MREPGFSLFEWKVTDKKGQKGRTICKQIRVGDISLNSWVP